jgi:hypothetical protein
VHSNPFSSKFRTSPQTVQSLPAFNVDITQSSVSGLSAGGYMAMQFEVAFSSILKGAGDIAGGPYYCAQGNGTTATSVCSCVPFGCFGMTSTNVPDVIRITDRNAAQGLIDGTASLSNGRFWLFSGTADTAVPQRIMDDLRTYLLHYVDSGNISYKNDIEAEHAQPTDFFGNPCNVRNHPFINNCNYDAAEWLPRGHPLPAAMRKDHAVARRRPERRWTARRHTD